MSSRPGPHGAPTIRAGSVAASDGERTISPADAAFSIRSVVVTAGPATTGSRCERPARQSARVPLCTPIDIRSVVRAPGATTGPAARSARRIPTAVRSARSACASPSKNSSSASPPNFSRPPPFAYATASSEVNEVPIASLIRSAPSAPSRASRSDSFVKPLTSAKTSVPGSIATCGPGASASARSATRGTYG